MKIIVGIVVIVALMVGGVIDVKVYPAELPKVPGRVLALVQGEEIFENGQTYVKELFASMKSDDSEESSEDSSGEVAGSKDEKKNAEENSKEATDTDKESKINIEGVSIPLRF